MKGSLSSGFYIVRDDRAILDLIETCDRMIEECEGEEIAFAVRATVEWLTDRNVEPPVEIRVPGAITPEMRERARLLAAALCPREVDDG